ncbi:hypothetical protein [Deinococcus radiotolerans]|uniref:Uncharacterized protein n=1 Tax=Deinococcus radiotolerans TaxID=1309407 RepID=A0ABQ2FLQ3_9DEIO|nr:hypothetical protein [Deinococcus radiotolerans]GGL07630.1 hypothetical protein GCM10010844_27990 [Deinococcus radiotolerans]
MQPPAVLSSALTLIAQAPALWPDFAPQRTPLLTFDGTRTWLHHAPDGPAEPGWTQTAGASVWPGRHPALNAHTAVTLPSGLRAAGVLLPDLSLPTAPAPAARVLAATLTHEAFHVYQQATPSVAWETDELAALTYPTGAAVRHARAEETHHLRRALHQADWVTSARRALHWRAQRHAQLSGPHQHCETRMETTEGLAQFVETRFLDERPRLDPVAATRMGLRAWAYHSGAALASLLTRTDAPWHSEMRAGHALADLLERHLGPPLPAPAHEHLRNAAHAAADAHDAELQARLSAFHAQPGPALHLSRAGGLTLTGFDPMNLHVLPGGALLHTRHLQLRAPDMTVETLNHAALVRGPTPLHVDALTLRGLPMPTLHAGRWQVRTPTLTVDLPAAAVQISGDGWSAQLP